MRSASQPPPGLDAEDLRGVAQSIAAGGLRGDDALDAVVDLITRAETPPGSGPRYVAETRAMVRSAVLEDPGLAEWLMGSERDTVEVDHTPPPVLTPAPPRPRRPSEPEARAERRELRRPKRREPDGGERVALLQAQRRNRMLVGGVVLFGALAVAIAYQLTRPGPCERLITSICQEFPGQCDPQAVQARFLENAVDSTRCSTTTRALEMGLEADGSNAGRADAYRTTLVDQLGFDPLKTAVAEPQAAPKAPAPVPLVTGLPTLSGLTIDGSKLYWTTSSPGGVHAMPSIGGVPQQIASTPAPADPDVTDDFVYWRSEAPEGPPLWGDKKRGDHEPMEIPLPEEPGYRPVAATFMGPRAAFIDESGAVVVLEVGVPEATVLVEAPADAAAIRPTLIASDAEHVYWAGPSAPLVRAALSGEPQPQTLVPTVGKPIDLTVHGDHVLWIDQSDGSIRRVSVEGGEVELLAQGQSAPADLAADDARVYWVNEQSGAIMARGNADGQVVALVTGQPGPTSIVVDGAAIYWAAGGNILRLPKPT